MLAAKILGIETARLQDPCRRPGPDEQMDSGAGNSVIATVRAPNPVNSRIDVHPTAENPRIQ